MAKKKNVYGKSKNGRKKNKRFNVPIIPKNVDVGLTVGIPTEEEIKATFMANPDVKHIIIANDDGSGLIYENPFYN